MSIKDTVLLALSNASEGLERRVRRTSKGICALCKAFRVFAWDQLSEEARERKVLFLVRGMYEQYTGSTLPSHLTYDQVERELCRVTGMEETE